MAKRETEDLKVVGSNPMVGMLNFFEICFQNLSANEGNFEGNFFGGRARRINRFNYFFFILILNMSPRGGQ